MNTDEVAIEMIRGREAFESWSYGVYRWSGTCFEHRHPDGGKWFLAQRLPPSTNWELLPEEPCFAKATQHKPEPEYEDVPVEWDSEGDEYAGFGWRTRRLEKWLANKQYLGAIFELPDGTQIGPLPEVALIWDRQHEQLDWHPDPAQQNRYETIRPKFLRFKKDKHECP